MIITHLCIREPVLGNKRGYCCICGEKTNKGHDVPFSNNFTGYSFLTHGDCVCPYCFTFFKNQNFRKKCWIATEKEVLFLKRQECEKYLLFPPDPPFAIYITQSHQRQGWLSGLQFVSFEKERFYILTDFVDVVFANLEWIKKIHFLIEKLRERKVGKEQLRAGEFSMYIYKKAIQQGWDDLLEEAKKYAKQPLWEVMLYVAK